MSINVFWKGGFFKNGKENFFSSPGLLLIVSILGCTSTGDTYDKLFEYEGTVLNKSNKSFLFVEEFVEIDQELSLEEAFIEYGRDKVIKFIVSKEAIGEFNVGNKVIVRSNGNFEDIEPRTGFTDDIKIIE